MLNTLQSNADVIQKWQEQRRVDMSVSLKSEMESLCSRAQIDVPFSLLFSF